jgi:glycosyltransferase involved in cell wall biosynthesis
VVTSDTHPQRAALGEAALFVPPGDTAALAAALRSLAADPGRVERLGAAARARAEDAFEPEAVVAGMRSRTEKLVRGTGDGRRGGRGSC